ncbi:hypothetical protein CDV31_004901 [Fusarium ambrosium]|uniref:Uncharacterized protein n=1 Tax=Fusarium ambrosium TaxID=131363 RepID=A0A428UMF4_9HYPO|nr:hypothetical protein CDV31_004901 [Fusarium ambrosium]
MSPQSQSSTTAASAFARLGVHILPILTSVTIVSLNLGGLYLGRGTLPGPVIDLSITSAMLQVVAKLQELLIVASLTSVVFNTIRDQLVSTMGSMEFWGALRSRLPLGTKILTALLLAAAGIISATAGPSIAVLLVPRIQDWDAGRGGLFLRGTVDQIFPDRLTNITISPAGDEILTSLCLSPNATNSALCLSAGFPSVMSHVASFLQVENGFDKGSIPRVINGPFSWHSVTVDSNLAAIPLSLLVGNPRGASCQASIIAPYLPAMMYQRALKEDWTYIIGKTFWESGKAETWSRTRYNWHRSWSLKTPSQIPIARTGCSLAQNIFAEGTKVSFLIMPEHSCWNETAALNVSQLDISARPRL